LGDRRRTGVWIDRRIALAFIAALGLVFIVMMRIALR
jgi:hypothetical protein